MDGSTNLANNLNQIIEFYHVPSKQSVTFKAFLTQFEDNYTSVWGSEQPFGKLDPIQTFQNTTRTISIGFDVVAGSLSESEVNLLKINLLLKMLYPKYSQWSNATTIKDSPYFKLQFMNLATDSSLGTFSGVEFSGLLGTVDGFSFSPDLEAGVFQADGSTGFGPDDDRIFPKVASISCQFTVLHQHRMGWHTYEIPKSTEVLTQQAGFNRFPYLVKEGIKKRFMPGTSPLEIEETERRKELASDPRRGDLNAINRRQERRNIKKQVRQTLNPENNSDIRKLLQSRKGDR